MEQNNLINLKNNSITHTKYPKSSNHKITWTKKDDVSTCDLNPNCMELIFNIRQNKNIKIINDIPLLDTLPTGNPPVYETFKCFSKNQDNYTIILTILAILLFIIFFLQKKTINLFN